MRQQRRIVRYQILEQVAGGGQGAVYRVWDSSNGRIAALKVLHPQFAGDPAVLEQGCRHWGRNPKVTGTR